MTGNIQQYFPEFIFNPTALRKAKIVYNFGLSECKSIKGVSKISQQQRILNKLNNVIGAVPY